MTVKNNYLLKAHEMFFQRTVELNNEVKTLSEKLTHEELIEHGTVKLAKRVYAATLEIIPQNPNDPDYYLKGDLKKYRRYKRGLDRYRLFFAFSTAPRIILYLYMNDRTTLRKEGHKSDPYEIFKGFVRQGRVSHDPLDPRIQRWVRDYSPVVQYSPQPGARAP